MRSNSHPTGIQVRCTEADNALNELKSHELRRAMKQRNFVVTGAVMLAAILSEDAVIPQEAAPPFDVQEKTIAQIQQAILNEADHDAGRR